LPDRRTMRYVAIVEIDAHDVEDIDSPNVVESQGGREVTRRVALYADPAMMAGVSLRGPCQLMPLSKLFSLSIRSRSFACLIQ
jgi:hypothetical protein